MTGSHFTKLISSNIRHGGVVRLLVILDWDLSSHAAHSVDASLVASLDQKFDIGIHEWHGHRNSRSVRQDKIWVLAKLFDRGENVIPSTAVETGRVIPEFINNLVHLKDSQDGLDQDGCSDSSSAHTNRVLSEVENVVPQPCLQMRFHLGQVKVWTGTSLDQFLSIVEKIETKVEKAARYWLTINDEMLFLEVPASWS